MNDMTNFLNEKEYIELGDEFEKKCHPLLALQAYEKAFHIADLEVTGKEKTIIELSPALIEAISIIEKNAETGGLVKPFAQLLKAQIQIAVLMEQGLNLDQERRPFLALEKYEEAFYAAIPINPAEDQGRLVPILNDIKDSIAEIEQNAEKGGLIQPAATLLRERVRSFMDLNL